MKRYVSIALASVLFFLIIGNGLKEPDYQTAFDVATFAKLPVQTGGRVLPLDTVARNSLRIISGKQTAHTVNTSGMPKAEKAAIDRLKISAIAWLMDTSMQPQVAADYPVFLINNAEVLGLMGMQQADRKRFSFNEIRPHFATISQQMEIVNKKDTQQRTPYERELAKLNNALSEYHEISHLFHTFENLDTLEEQFIMWEETVKTVVVAFRNRDNGQPPNPTVAKRFEDFYRGYQMLAQSTEVRIVPPRTAVEKEQNDWSNMGETLLDTIIQPNNAVDPIAFAYGRLVKSYRSGDADAFNAAVTELQMDIQQDPALQRVYRVSILPNVVVVNLFNSFMQAVAAFAGNTSVYDVVEFEATFNHVAPFYYGLMIYVIIFVCAFIYMQWPKLGTFLITLTLLTFCLHTFGLFSRMYIQNRPPVTNLYSSAVFIGWSAMLLGIVVERVFFKVIGQFISALILMVGACIGFTTLIIAHFLAATGDTLEMMRAVLDSNFWLSTHVITITLGYASMYLAGILGAAYILFGLLTRKIDPKTSLMLNRITYGIICFSVLFSFVGTMLGGIWADQSWGRFWGWDPKENGALIIVLWCALVLHARWGGLVKTQGLMVLCVAGNIITSWSWFGTNMLGIGLHAYGFMDAGFIWLITFVASQLFIMGLGMLPAEFWRSFSAPAAVSVRVNKATKS